MSIVPFMKPKAALLFKAFTTSLTLELFEIGVTSHVIGKPFFTSKCPVTHVTGIRFFAGVYPFMLLQIVLSRKAFLTVLTHVWPIPSVSLEKNRYSS